MPFLAQVPAVELRAPRLREELAVLIGVHAGQAIRPRAHHPTADLMGDEELNRFLDGIGSRVDRTVAQQPRHEACVKQYCVAVAQPA